MSTTFAFARKDKCGSWFVHCHIARFTP